MGNSLQDQLLNAGLVSEDQVKQANKSKKQQQRQKPKAKKKALEIRMTTASNRVATRRTLHDGRIDDAMARYATLERRIDELEADAESYDLGKERSLADEFADLEAENGVEDELQEMKSRLSGRSSEA